MPEYTSPKEKFKTFYDDTLDSIIFSLKSRFNQEGYQIVMNMENLLFKSAMGKDCKEEFKIVTDYYGNDFDPDLLAAQLLTFRAQYKEINGDMITTLDEIIEFMSKPGHTGLLSEISTLLKLILVLPATNAQSERVFSALKRIKTYLRNTMGQDRLNSIMLLNIHFEEAEKLSLAAVANKFASKFPKRRNDFGDQKFV